MVGLRHIDLRLVDLRLIDLSTYRLTTYQLTTYRLTTYQLTTYRLTNLRLTDLRLTDLRLPDLRPYIPSLLRREPKAHNSIIFRVGYVERFVVPCDSFWRVELAFTFACTAERVHGNSLGGEFQERVFSGVDDVDIPEIIGGNIFRTAKAANGK